MSYKLFDKEIFIDGKTGIFAFSESKLRELLDSNPFDYDSFNPSFLDYNPTSATFCINLSDSCNLRCDYCFNQNKQNRSISIDDALLFLDTCFSTFPNKEKYFVDLSGKGEPLLFLNKILAVKRYCDQVSNKLNREVLVQFVCNGTLLNPLVANILQNNGILFGVSLDGNEYIHDKHRLTKNGNKTFRTIVNAVESIPQHEYVGAACTLTSDVFSLKDSLIELSKIFNTISYKPSRDCEWAINEKTIAAWLESYDELTNFLIEQTVKGELKYIKVLLNGEDYFGKFIKRIVLQQRNVIRCDAGLSRFTLDDDGCTYICPAAFKSNQFIVGDKEHIDLKLSSYLFDEQIQKNGCHKCDFRNICGGECLIEKQLSNGTNKTMCKYKMHLILLAIYLSNAIYEKNVSSFKIIYDFCIEVDNRKRIDKKLDIFLKKHLEYNFIEGKKIYDKEEKRY